jgi:asparagine synthase (glutamine-hydrolysing)
VIGPVRRRIAESRGLPRFDWLEVDRLDAAEGRWTAASARDESPDPSHLNRILYRETKHTNVPAVLMHGDRNSMAHSLEVRYPYLDHRLVEFCFSLPASYKVGFGRRKRLLWETSKDCLPPLVMQRKDKKYFVLLTNWMPLRERGDELRAAARHEAFERLPWLDPGRMRRFVDAYLGGRHDNAYAVWRIFTASRWFALNGL